MKKSKIQHICEICDKIFPKASTLQKHVNDVHFSRKRKCDYCDKVFYRSKVMMLHIANVHRNLAKKTKCHICSKSYKRSRALTDCVHMRLKLGESPKSRILTKLGWINHICKKL